MKQAILLLFVFAAYSSCKKDKTKAFQNKGVITGFDMRQCPCVLECPCSCGTILFHFTDTSYTDNIPVDNQQIFNFNSGTKFPVNIELNWQNTSRCNTTAIKVIDYKIF